MKNKLFEYNDNELLYLIKDNNEDAFLVLYEKYQILIKTKIAKLINKKEEYEEYFSEGILTFNKAIKTFNENRNKTFYGYFELLLTRRFIDLYRLNKKKEKIVYQENLHEIVEDKKVRESKGFNEDIGIFSKIEQEIYLKKYIEGKKAIEIANELNLSIRQVYDGSERVRKKIKINSNYN